MHFFRTIPKEAQAVGLHCLATRWSRHHISAKQLGEHMRIASQIQECHTELLFKIFTDLDVSDFGSCLVTYCRF
jgi:hypothetical protein